MYRMTRSGFGLDPSYGQPAPSAPSSPSHAAGFRAAQGYSFAKLITNWPMLPAPSDGPPSAGPPSDGTVQLPPSEPAYPDPAGVVPGGGVTYPPDDVATGPVPPPPPPPPVSTEPGAFDELEGWWSERSGVEKGAVVLAFVGVGVASYVLGRRRGQASTRAPERF